MHRRQFSFLLCQFFLVFFIFEKSIASNKNINHAILILKKIPKNLPLPINTQEIIKNFLLFGEENKKKELIFKILLERSKEKTFQESLTPFFKNIVFFSKNKTHPHQERYTLIFSQQKSFLELALISPEIAFPASKTYSTFEENEEILPIDTPTDLTKALENLLTKIECSRPHNKTIFIFVEFFKNNFHLNIFSKNLNKVLDSFHYCKFFPKIEIYTENDSIQIFSKNFDLKIFNFTKEKFKKIREIGPNFTFNEIKTIFHINKADLLTNSSFNDFFILYEKLGFNQKYDLISILNIRSKIKLYNFFANKFDYFFPLIQRLLLSIYYEFITKLNFEKNKFYSTFQHLEELVSLHKKSIELYNSKSFLTTQKNSTFFTTLSHLNKIIFFTNSLIQAKKYLSCKEALSLANFLKTKDTQQLLLLRGKKNFFHKDSSLNNFTEKIFNEIKITSLLEELKKIVINFLYKNPKKFMAPFNQEMFQLMYISLDSKSKSILDKQILYSAIMLDPKFKEFVLNNYLRLQLKKNKKKNLYKAIIFLKNVFLYALKKDEKKQIQRKITEMIFKLTQAEKIKILKSLLEQKNCKNLLDLEIFKEIKILYSKSWRKSSIEILPLKRLSLSPITSSNNCPLSSLSL